MAKQRNRISPWGDDGPLKVWFTVETSDGNAVADVDGRFDLETEEEALRLLDKVIAEVGKPLTVVEHKKSHLATYQAVMKIEKVEAGDASVD